MAFLQVVTRTFGKRPKLLQRCIESVAQQTDPDFEHTIIMDAQGRGVNWANANLATVEATGQYVWVLDDDDVCCRPTLVCELKEIAQQFNGPDVIMVRSWHAKFGTLPSIANWNLPPVLGNIGTSCYLVRGDVWNAHHDLWRETYAADFYFIADLFQVPGIRIAWYDMTAAYYPQQSNGAEYAR